MRRTIGVTMGLLLIVGGGGAFFHMIQAHTGYRWMYGSAAMLFMAGVMVAYDEVVGPCE